jgi:C-terminal processing protease CtpA/Prc
MMQLPSPRAAARASEANPQDSRTNMSPPSHSNYVGVGIVFDEKLRVLNLVKGGAAERNGGILRYDLLVAVDGRSMAAASTEQLKIAVRGPPGTLASQRHRCATYSFVFQARLSCSRSRARSSHRTLTCRS